MKILSFTMILIFININSCGAQERLSIEKAFIKSFVQKNKDNDVMIVKNQLLIWGSGNDLTIEGVKIIYLSLEEIKTIVLENEEFNLVRLEDIILENKQIKTSFMFLKAVNRKEKDFILMDNRNSFYCINIEEKYPKAIWCGEPLN
ncbi:hypothetical protein [Aquimarina macrocephali]|uniref:hypothetical protein n=1 Tax=Aquimarina macrocephali TaxID=666563 RepID=UPI003F663C83